MRIAQVSAAQTAGGAERVAVDLHECFLAAGHEAVLLTPKPDPTQTLDGVIPIDVDAWRPAWRRGLSRIDRRLARPRAAVRRRRGYDDFDYPWTAGLLDLLPWTPDVLHLHNLHGGWFDLRQLASLSRRVPVVVTLHDAHLLTGGPHFSCLTEYWDGAVRETNRRKRLEAWGGARLHVVTPSRWMLDRVPGSELEVAAASRRVIANGVDTGGFVARDRALSRELFGGQGSAEGPYVLAVGLTGRGGATHKDPRTLVEAFGLLRASRPGAALWLLGGDGRGDPALARSGVVQHAGVGDRARLANFYAAADVVVHAAVEDNHPLTVLEAMACGAAVVSTREGGMAEQIEDGRTGLLVPAGDAGALAEAVSSLLEGPERAAALGRAAAEKARETFDRSRMVRDYVALYAELCGEAGG